MAKNKQKEAAAHARACRLACQDDPTSITTASDAVTDNHNDDLALNIVDSDLDSDCGYTGGVNCDWSDSEYMPGSDSEDEWSDEESLACYGDSPSQVNGGG
jgi:hypothetical protein